MDRAISFAQQCGFSHWGPVNMGALKFLPDVRNMCAAGKCRQYGHSWSCPPACGSLEEAEQKAHHYTKGILLQSTGQMEDDFDIETINDTESAHKQRLFQFVQAMRERVPDCLPLAAGSCTVCSACAYPEPCRFPDRAIPSMEAYGILVSQLCADSGVGYYYGPQTITFTSCVLF